MDFFKYPVKNRDKPLTMFAVFSIKFTYPCLRQVYGVFSPHLFPAFDHSEGPITWRISARAEISAR